MEKVIDFEDKGIKFVLLGRGDYLIDGEVVSVDSYEKSKIGVKDENNIRKIRNTTVIDHYINVEDNTSISKYEYEERKSELLKHRTLNEYEEDVWDSLENEFNYRKFIQTWDRIDKDIQVISEPILVEKVVLKYNTGNDFIKNAYLNGGDISYCDLYVYNRHKAYLHIVEECFDELNMTYEEDCGHEYTKNKKIWSNSNHSGIRYVEAFGGYVFGDEFKNIHSSRGTYEEMLGMYEKDRNSIRKIIRNRYITPFGNVDENKVDFKLLLKDLYSLRENINSIESKKSTWSSQNAANRKVNEIINYLENKFE